MSTVVNTAAHSAANAPAKDRTRAALAGWMKRLVGQLADAGRKAAQWRLLLLWLLGLSLPPLLLSLPLWLALAGPLDHSLLGKQLVEGFDAAVYIEVLMGLARRGQATSAGIGAMLVFLLLLPWLTGITMTAARSTQRLGFGALLKGGLTEYGPMARLWLWAVVPLGLASALGAGVLYLVKQQALTLTLEADAAHLRQVALAFSALLLLLALATLDAARAQWLIEPRRRSVIAAWWRGARGLVRRPGRVLLYLLLTGFGLLLAAVLGGLRVQLPPVSGLSFALALLLGQALTLVLAWMRCARLFALAAAARDGRFGSERRP